MDVFLGPRRPSERPWSPQGRPYARVDPFYAIHRAIYAPNGNPQPGPKFNYKLAWLKRLEAHAAELYAAGVPVVLAGDYNVVPTDGDIYPTTSWDKDALLQPASRAAYARILALGWADAIRSLYQSEPMYTFWDYKRNRWERDGGLGLDHILLNPALTGRLQAAGVDRAVRGEKNASDHAPVWIELSEVVKPLEPHKNWLLGLVAREPDLTLRELEQRIREELGLVTSERSIRRLPPSGSRGCAESRVRLRYWVRPTMLWKVLVQQSMGLRPRWLALSAASRILLVP